MELGNCQALSVVNWCQVMNDVWKSAGNVVAEPQTLGWWNLRSRVSWLKTDEKLSSQRKSLNPNLQRYAKIFHVSPLRWVIETTWVLGSLVSACRQHDGAGHLADSAGQTKISDSWQLASLVRHKWFREIPSYAVFFCQIFCEMMVKMVSLLSFDKKFRPLTSFPDRNGQSLLPSFWPSRLARPKRKVFATLRHGHGKFQLFQKTVDENWTPFGDYLELSIGTLQACVLMHCVDLIVAGWRAHEPYHYVSQPGNFSCGYVSFIHDPRQFTRNSHCVQQAGDSIITGPKWKLENKGTFQYSAMYRECTFSFLVLFLLWHAIGWIKTSGTTTKCSWSHHLTLTCYSTEVAFLKFHFSQITHIMKNIYILYDLYTIFISFASYTSSFISMHVQSCSLIFITVHGFFIQPLSSSCSFMYFH